ncbi:MAG TPA: malto-oligosyltrehalose synthase [Verrucomicrobiae bacterium]|nr:malto-oligosyltrehalose synthase [Verrucomicrobiae bacterium]
MEVPRATYRLQFNERFQLVDALRLVPYLFRLGISHLYASPLFKARPHSGHGYDVCDFGELNPELGSEANLEKLAASLREHGMGLVLDVVPNHMGIGSPENHWWWDVLKNGRASRFADYFDINWCANGANSPGKILVPVLGDEYERVLNRGELKIKADQGEPVLVYFENKLPLAPGTVPKADVVVKSEAVDEVVQKQHYRLVSWRHGDQQLNYRRFFAISTLAGLRVEEEQVFNDSHALLRKWLENKLLDGLRVDHADGLRDPKQYLERLRSLAPDQWIVVEKILQPKEMLPADWPVQGTVGYDFLNQVNGLFVQSKNARVLTDFYAEFTGESSDSKEAVQEKKRLVLRTLFTTEVNRLVDILLQVAPSHSCQKVPREHWREALIEFIASFPIYRTYIRPGENVVGKNDFRFVEQAAVKAKALRPNLSPELFDFISDLMLLLFRGERECDFVARVQQLTGPAMAKGVEDTAFYCLNRLISLNEVGGDPGKFGVGVEEFHQFCQAQQTAWPHSMLASSTHDTKRSEDVRARINLLSEIPNEWRAAVLRWSTMNGRHRQNNFPDRNAEYFFYQTLVGAWPLPLDRALDAMQKASCEAKQHTDWNHPHAEYEQALKHFIVATLADGEFIRDLAEFISPLADGAHINSLSQTLIKLTAPGVPDIYQGNEILDYSLVDPDNRRLVDFEFRNALLDEAENLSATEAWRERDRGLAKLWLTKKTLSVRARFKAAFEGDYRPLFARGEKANHLVAFLRGAAITAVPRFTLELNGAWNDLILELPDGNWRNTFTGEIDSGKVAVADLFRIFPVALLLKGE